MDPGRCPEDVLLALAIVDSGRLHVGIVGHLVIVEPKPGVESNLILGIGIVEKRSKSAAAVRLVVQVDAGRWLESPLRVLLPLALT